MTEEKNEKIECPYCRNAIIITKKGRGFCEECNEITMSIFDIEHYKI